jgi:hypothetical protein
MVVHSTRRKKFRKVYKAENMKELTQSAEIAEFFWNNSRIRASHYEFQEWLALVGTLRYVLNISVAN